MTDHAPNAWDALSLDRHGFIEASAGTGKTFTIENLVVRILTEPDANPWNRLIDLEEILIVTYTEKATEELRSRIRKKLEDKLLALENIPLEGARHIERCLMRFDRACIHTFHGFCNRFLNAHAFESQSPFGPDAGQTDAAELALRSVREIVRGPLMAGAWADCDKMRTSLDKWGIGNVDDFCGTIASVIQKFGGGRDAFRPCLQDGKIISLYIHLRADFCAGDPDDHPFVRSWAGIKAALKLKTDPKKKGAALKALLSLPKLDTAEQVLAFFRQEPPSCAVLLKDPAIYFLPVESETSESYRRPGAVAKVIDEFRGRSFTEYINRLGALHDAMTEHNAALDRGAFYSIIKDAHAGYLRYKQRSGIRTFDDMIRCMHGALLGMGNNDQMLSALRKRFRYGIIDEFQDTNALQWDIFRRIFVDDKERRPPAQKSCLYVVGDPKQSVFSFQGSDVAVYQKAITGLKHEGAGDVPLKINFRSSPAMVHACNGLFIDNTEMTEGGDWFMSRESGIRPSAVAPWGGVTDIDCSDTAPPELRAPVVFKNLYSVNVSGQETRKKADKERDLARWICSMTEYLLQQDNGRTPLRVPLDGPGDQGRGTAFRNMGPADICILVEKHSEARPVMRLLREKGISYTKQRNTGLFVSDECLHLLAMLDAVDRPSDGVAVKKALLTRFFGISPSDLGETPDLSEDAWKDRTELLRRFSAMAGRRQWGLLFGELFKATELIKGLAREGERKLRLAALRQLRDYCLRCLIERRMTLTELVARLRLLYNDELSEAEDENIFHKETEGDGVRILTMHSAKGLEFPIVFIAGGKGGEARKADHYEVHNAAGGTDFWFGTAMGRALSERLRGQEARRLYYVALTRAKYRLFAPVWDMYDPVAGSIVQAGKWRDASSASALFLSRRFAEAAKANEKLFSFIGDVLPAHGAANAPLPAAGTGGPATVSLGVWNGHDGAPPAARMTVVHSYSGIVRLAQRLGVRVNPGADEPQETEEDFAEKKNVVLEPGAKTGNALHDILEQADFGRWAPADPSADLPPDRALLDKSLSGHGLLLGTAKDVLIRDAAARIVKNTLCAVFPDPAADGDIMLGNIPGGDRKSEAEFHFTFAKDRALFPRKDRAIGGWVLGFIDLLFRRDNRYYLVDWKSNWVREDNYGAEIIAENMKQHRYDVQYRVYGLALHNWLKLRLPAYDPKINFGGVIYVYLRGTRPGTAHGIWSTRPTPGELETEWPLFVKERLKEISGAVP